MNLIRTTFRSLKHNKFYSSVNIAGLAIGMAVAMLMFVWIYHEWSYDRFHAKEKLLYSVWNRAELDGSLQCWDWTSSPLGPTLKTDYPDIAATARMRYHTMLYTNEDKKLNLATGITDPDFLTMFDFPLLQGNKETALNDPYSVILTEKIVERLFGGEDPMGKTVLIDNEYPLTVTGVMKDLPSNTAFRFEILVPVSFIKVRGQYKENWRGNSLQTYVELQPMASLDATNQAIRNIVKEHTNNEVQTEVFLYPLNKYHLYTKFENGVPVGGLIDTLRLFGVIAILILLVACINFMNLSTARSEKRAKEVGVRKVMGSKRSSLVGQFLGESVITAFIAGILALALVLLALPVFEILMGTTMTLDLTSGWFWLAWLVFILFTGLLAGSYPAFYLSSFLPIKVLKGMFRKERALVAPRKILVVVQFSVACFLIIATLIVHRQIMYAQNRESGYNKDLLVYHMLNADLRKNYELVRQDLLNSGAATSVTKNSSPMSEGWNSTWSVNWKGKNPDEKTTFEIFFTDDNWVQTVGATMIDGRDIDIHTYSTDSTAMLLSETAVKIMNFDHPVGEIVNTQGTNWHVVGVFKDFILRSPYESTAPMIIGGPAGFFDVMHIKLNEKRSIADNLATIEQVFKEYTPAYPFEYKFIDEAYARKFANEQRTSALAGWFAGFTIFISCLGLFALVSYMAETRKKEIGIRKVLGASVPNITILLSKEFLILVLISFVIAAPIAWWAMSQWLSNYSYRTNMPWWIFVLVGFVSVLIALLTVGFQAIKAATANPVNSIKTE